MIPSSSREAGWRCELLQRGRPREVGQCARGCRAASRTRHDDRSVYRTSHRNIISTLTEPPNRRMSPSKVSLRSRGLTGNGVMISVSWTVRGTVLSIRANSSAHVDAKSSGEPAKLCDNQRDIGSRQRKKTHEPIVSSPPLRPSELILASEPTTSGFWPVLAI